MIQDAAKRHKRRIAEPTDKDVIWPKAIRGSIVRGTGTGQRRRKCIVMRRRPSAQSPGAQKLPSSCTLFLYETTTETNKLCGPRPEALESKYSVLRRAFSFANQSPSSR